MGLLSKIRGRLQRSGTQADKPIQPANRRGLLRGTAIGGGWANKDVHYSYVAEVEEIDRIGHLSKLKFHKITGVDKDRLLDIMPEWIETKDVIWKADAPKGATGEGE
jgi:hypothetical protein